MYHLYVTTDIYRICQIFVAHFRIWGGLSNALGRLSLPKPPRGAATSAKFGVVFNITQLCAAHVTNFETNMQHGDDRPMSSPSLVSWVHAPENCLVKVPHLLKLYGKKRAKSSITQPLINRFRSTFVQSLNTSHPKCCKSSRS